MEPSLELLVVLPVHNEQESIGAVISDWTAALDRTKADYAILAIDDGSTDGTAVALLQLKLQYSPRLRVITQPNLGHGQSCLKGYRYAESVGAQRVLQIDSDGQCDPQFFPSLWELRHRCDVVYGERAHRDDGFARVVVSGTLRWMLRLAFRVDCCDANVPYRLMRTDVIQNAVARIPAGFHLANVALALLLAQDQAVTHGFVPIRFRRRHGGEPSVRWWAFARRGVELYFDLRALLRQAKPNDRTTRDTNSAGPEMDAG